MKLLDVKTFSAGFVLVGLMTAPIYVAAATDKTVLVDDVPAPPSDMTIVNREQKPSANRGGELVCQDYNQDRIITFDECTFTEN
jgi:hypothetical protein